MESFKFYKSWLSSEHSILDKTIPYEPTFFYNDPFCTPIELDEQTTIIELSLPFGIYNSQHQIYYYQCAFVCQYVISENKKEISKQQIADAMIDYQKKCIDAINDSPAYQYLPPNYTHIRLMGGGSVEEHLVLRVYQSLQEL